MLRTLRSNKVFERRNKGKPNKSKRKTVASTMRIADSIKYKQTNLSPTIQFHPEKKSDSE